MKYLSLFLWGMACLMGMTSMAQSFDLEGSLSFNLSDSSEVKVISRRGEPGIYYYFPTQLRLAQNRQGENEISFLGIREAEGQELEGAILHWLFTWGLSREQQEELDSLLKVRIDSTALLWGALPLSLHPDSPHPHFVSEEGSDLKKVLESHLSSQGQVPNFPGGKWAASYNLDRAGAKKVEDAIRNPEKWGDLRLQFQWQLGLQGQTLILEAYLRDLLSF